MPSNDMFRYHVNTETPDGRFTATGGGGSTGSQDNPGYIFHAVGHTIDETGADTSVTVIHNGQVSNSVSVFVIDHEVTVVHSNSVTDAPLL